MVPCSGGVTRSCLFFHRVVRLLHRSAHYGIMGGKQKKPMIRKSQCKLIWRGVMNLIKRQCDYCGTMCDFLYENVWRGVTFYTVGGAPLSCVFKATEEAALLGCLAAFPRPWLLFIFVLSLDVSSLSVVGQFAGKYEVIAGMIKERLVLGPPVRPLGPHE